MESKADVKKQLILDTAKRIILEDDFHSLTLDAVAKKAGISKGGLLYHFPNKEALIKGLAYDIFEEFSSNFYNFAENDVQEYGKWSRSLISASIIDLEQNGELSVGVLATSLLDPEVAKHISGQYNSIFEKLDNDGINPVTGNIIRLTIDGLYYSRMLNVAPLEEEKVREVFQQLMRLTRK